MIRLGFCFDLLDPYNVRYLKEIHEAFLENERAAKRKPPQNANNRKFLDCAVFQYGYSLLEADEKNLDTVRAVYVPTGMDKRIWTRSWISEGSHIQLCVRNTSNIHGTWLHMTSDGEDTHV